MLTLARQICVGSRIASPINALDCDRLPRLICSGLDEEEAGCGDGQSFGAPGLFRRLFFSSRVL